MRIALIIVLEEYNQQAVRLIEFALNKVLPASVTIYLKKVFPRKKKIAVFIECHGQCADISDKIRKEILELDASGEIGIRWIIVQPIIAEIVIPTNISRLRTLCRILEKIYGISDSLSFYSRKQIKGNIGKRRADHFPAAHKLYEAINTSIMPMIEKKIFQAEKIIRSIGAPEYELTRTLLLLGSYGDDKIYINRIMENEGWLFDSEIDDVRNRLMRLEKINIISISEDGQIIVRPPINKKLRDLMRRLEGLVAEISNVIHSNVEAIIRTFDKAEEIFNTIVVVLESGEVLSLKDYIKQKCVCDTKIIESLCIILFYVFYPEKIISEREAEYVINFTTKSVVL